MAEREHRDPSQEALQKQKKKGRAVWLGLAVAAAVVVPQQCGERQQCRIRQAVCCQMNVTRASR